MKHCYDSHFAMAACRAAAINHHLYRSALGIFTMRQVDAYRSPPSHAALGYVVTLGYWAGCSPQERIGKFQVALSLFLSTGESLGCRGRCFFVEGNEYIIAYTVEVYKTHADRVCFVEDGETKVALLHRMGVDFAFRHILSRREPKFTERIWERLRIPGFRHRYSNPADRFIASVNAEKALCKSEGLWGHSNSTD